MPIGIRAFSFDIAHRFVAILHEVNRVNDSHSPKSQPDQHHVVWIVINQQDDWAGVRVCHGAWYIHVVFTRIYQGIPETVHDFRPYPPKYYSAIAYTSRIVATNKTPFAAVTVPLIGTAKSTVASNFFSFEAANTHKSPRRLPK